MTWLSETCVLDDEMLLRSPEEVSQLSRAWRLAGPLEWGGFMLRRGAKLHQRSEVGSAPNSPGIYGLCASDGGLCYIGKASSLHARLKQHWYSSTYRGGPWWTAYCFRQVPEYAVRDVEVAHIHALEPEWNKLYESTYWQGHEALASAIGKDWGIDG